MMKCMRAEWWKKSLLHLWCKVRVDSLFKKTSCNYEQHWCVKRQTKEKSRSPPPCAPFLKQTTKGRGKNSHQDHKRTPDRSQSTIAGNGKQEHVCCFCNMQQSTCNYIPHGISRLQQSGVFFCCQFWQVFTKHAHLETKPIIWGRSSPEQVLTHVS